MKKWLAVLLLLAIIGGAAWYFSLPAQYHFNQGRTIQANSLALSRNLVEIQNWDPWWPGKRAKPQGKELAAFEWDGIRYLVTDRKYSSLDLEIEIDGFSFPAQLQLIAAPANRNEVNWTASIDSNKNVLTRFKAWRISRKLSKQLEAITNRMADYYRDEKNLYALPIHEQKVADSNLVSTYKTFQHDVRPDDYYSMIDELTSYIKRHDAEATGLPMLNISLRDSGNCLVRVALPVNHRLPDSATIVYRWMLGRGNILIADVSGGPTAIQKAFTEMEYYVTDHNRVPPAIPFQSLVTDRRAVPDTAQWKTRLYYPVM